tara:strand:- start:65 stop:802 length:738 start_codon:yes stop_codon:yes gene_type:complete
MKNILYTITLSFLFSFSVFAESAKEEYINAAGSGVGMVIGAVFLGLVIMYIHRLLRYIFRKLFNINFDLSGLGYNFLNSDKKDYIEREYIKFERIDAVKKIDNIEQVDAAEEIVALDDEHIYEQVAKEFSTDTIRQGLWLKVQTESGGDEAKAKALYTKIRVSQIKKAEQERLMQEMLEQERLEQEEQERLEQEKIEQERLDKMEEDRVKEEKGRKRKRRLRRYLVFIPLFIIGATIIITIVFSK